MAGRLPVSQKAESKSELGKVESSVFENGGKGEAKTEGLRNISYNRPLKAPLPSSPPPVLAFALPLPTPVGDRGLFSGEGV